MATNYIQLHIGDFLGDTMEMDHAEIGAYWLLLIAHYKNGFKGLPADTEKLKRICRIQDRRAWHRVKETVLSKFVERDGWLTHDRVLEELSKHKKPIKEAKASELMTELGDKSVQTLEDNPLKNNNRHSPKPITSNQEPISTKKNTKKSPERFDEFWEMYPRQRRGAKDRAWQAYCKAIDENRANEEEIINGLQAYSGSDEVRNGYAKGAAAWLNDDRWANDYSVNPERGKAHLAKQKPAYSDTVLAASERARQQLRVSGSGWGDEADTDAGFNRAGNPDGRALSPPRQSGQDHIAPRTPSDAQADGWE